MSDTAAAVTKQAPSPALVIARCLPMGWTAACRETGANRILMALDDAGYMIIGKAEFRALKARAGK